MLTLEDCTALSNLTREEIDAIAEHEHLPEIIAMEMGAYLRQLPEGGKAIKGIIRDDIASARMRGDYLHSAKLKLMLRHFIEHRLGVVPKEKSVGSIRPASLRNNIGSAALVISEENRLRHLADCWRRLAEVDSYDQRSYRLAWADYLDRLARLKDRPEFSDPDSPAEIGAR